MKKAIVFDNSGTLIERYRVIKDINTGNLSTDMSSLELVDQNDTFALVVLQYNTNKLLDLNPNTLISDVITEYDIDFDISFTNFKTTKEDVREILLNEKSAVISDITDGFPILKKLVPHMELCNGSALILDMKAEKVAYTITSAGKLFDGVVETVDDLKSRGYEIFLASGDRKGAINKLAEIIGINKDNAHGSVSTRGKCEVIKSLQDSGYKVMMVGDGLNDVLAFKRADVSVLTIEQQDQVSPKLLDKTDHIIDNIREVSGIDF